jgi:hypothetical protein
VPTPPAPLNSRVGLFVNGERLTVTDAYDPAGSYNYAADISAYAGREATISFTKYRMGPYPSDLILDAISFSDVPEPSSWALLACGGLAVAAWRLVFDRRRKRRKETS